MFIFTCELAEVTDAGSGEQRRSSGEEPGEEQPPPGSPRSLHPACRGCSSALGSEHAAALILQTGSIWPVALSPSLLPDLSSFFNGSGSELHPS